MTDDATRLKTISDNIEGMYQALRQCASNIAGLLQAGRATCDEIKAYNLWALATYNTQAGMLDTLRANGETGIPDLPTAPTLFVWNGVDGSDAWSIDCTGQPSDLSGLMGRVLKGPTVNTVYVNSSQVSISTQDQNAYNPTASPSFQTLVAVQQARAQQQVAGLGVIGILIAIAGIALAVSVAIVAIMHYLDTNAVQEANTAQTRLQAEAFANYTAARLQCLTQCTQGGQTVDQCTSLCEGLITKPNITLPGQSTSWGMLQWIGFVVVAGGITIAAWRLHKRHQEGKPLFELPESVEHAIHPGA